MADAADLDAEPTSDRLALLPAMAMFVLVVVEGMALG
jgi:hypothetical protein